MLEYVKDTIEVGRTRGGLMLALTLLSLCWVCDARLMAAVEHANDPNVFIAAEPNIIKGFPVVIRVEAKGPLLAPKLSLFDEEAEIRVVLASTTGEGRYTIESRRIRRTERVVTTPDGERVDYDPRAARYQVFLHEKERRTMLCELFSLRSGIPKGLVFDDVPSGKYYLSIEFPWFGLTSNSIPVKVLDASTDEKLFLVQTGKLGKDLTWRTGVNWPRLLRGRVGIPQNNLNKLNKVAQRQLQFHMLLSEVLSSELAARDINIETLKAKPVPKYLEPEKEFLLQEIEKASAKDVSDKMNRLLEKEPGLKWRLEQVKVDGHNFLLYKSLKSRQKKDGCAKE